MADKDFRVKNGLVVEGPTATVNGNNVLTTASSIDSLQDVNTAGVQNTNVLNYVNGVWVPASTASLQGPQGPQGIQGLTGLQGIQGSIGDDGFIAQSEPPANTSLLWLDTDEAASTPNSITVTQPLVNTGTETNAIINFDASKYPGWNHRKYIAGYDYSGPAKITASVMVTSELKPCPLVITQTTTLSSIGIYVTSSAINASVRLGIYSNSVSQDYPSTLILDAGVVSATTSGGKSVTISQVLQPGLYWLVACSQGANPPTIYMYTDGPVNFLPSISTLTSPYVWKDTVAAALPATFTVSKSQSLYAPAISWKVSA